jgi:hypothetical protein
MNRVCPFEMPKEEEGLMKRCVIVTKDKTRSCITRIANNELFMDREIIRPVSSAISMSFRNSETLRVIALS